MTVPGPSRAQNVSSSEPPCKAVWFPDRTAWRSGDADLSAPKFDLHRGAAALARLVQVRPRRLPRPRRLILSGWEFRTRTLTAASFQSITCSQKEVTALLPLSLANSASRIAGGERPIRFLWPHLRRTVFQRMLRQIHARIALVVTRGRLFSDSVQVFTGAPVSGEHLRHPVSQGGRFLYPDA